MKANKCKYCGYRFTPKEWHEEHEKETCFSCRCLSGLVKSIQVAMAFQRYNQQSKDYWSKQIDKIL